MFVCGHVQSSLRYALSDCATAVLGGFHRRDCHRADAQLRHAVQPPTDAGVKMRPLFKARVAEVARPVVYSLALKAVNRFY